MSATPKIPSTLLSSTSSGALEYDGTRLYFDDASARRIVPIVNGSPANGQSITWDSTANLWQPTTLATGSVTAVGLALPSIFSVTNSPVTTTGTLTGSLANQSTNTVFAGPNGSTGTPTFRQLVAADIPSLDASILTAGTLSASRLPTIANAALANSSVTLGSTSVSLGATASSVAGLTSLTSGTVTGSTSVSSPSVIVSGAGSGVFTQTYGNTSNNLGLIWPNSTPSANQVLSVSSFSSNTATLAWTTPATGSVTSVALSLPDIFSVTNSPVTSSGTLTGTLVSQSASTVLAAPSGGAGTPSFRTLVSGDIPSLDASKITAGTLAVDRGGTGLGSYTAGGVPYASGTTALTSTAAPTATNQVLMSTSTNGSSAPTWTTATNANTASAVVQRDSSGNFSAGSVSVSGLTLASLNGLLTAASGIVSTVGSQTANTVYAAPNGSAGTPGFRTLAAADIPSLDAAKITAGTIPVSRGGTGQTGSLVQGGIAYGSSTTAMATTSAGTAGQVLVSNGTSAPAFGTMKFSYAYDQSVSGIPGTLGATFSSSGGTLLIAISGSAFRINNTGDVGFNWGIDGTTTVYTKFLAQILSTHLVIPTGFWVVKPAAGTHSIIVDRCCDGNVYVDFNDRFNYIVIELPF